MADRMNPNPRLGPVGEFKDVLVKGDKTHWSPIGSGRACCDLMESDRRSSLLF
ncbi:MAG: hypothetical protein JWO83_4589 [Caulobacteraceae bacterium]|nr:hypothetical protein [Caulobacteraceae bacterium]